MMEHLFFTILNFEQAAAHGVKYDEKPPSPTVCKFCGRPVEYVGIVRNGHIKRWFQNACDCEEAKAEREREREREVLEIVEREQQRYKIAKINSMIESCGMKKRFMNRTFENYKPRRKEQVEALNIARRYARDFAYHKEEGDGLYFVGSNGTGKTHLAAAIALQLMPSGVSVIFKTAAALLNDVKQSFDGERTEAEIVKTYTDADLLIIDDLGKEQCTDWAISMLFTIINNRYEDCKPIIITSNYTPEDLVQALTPKGYSNDKAKAIVSRLNGTSDIVSMFWPDYRCS